MEKEKYVKNSGTETIIKVAAGYADVHREYKRMQ